MVSGIKNIELWSIHNNFNKLQIKYVNTCDNKKTTATNKRPIQNGMI